MKRSVFAWVVVVFLVLSGSAFAQKVMTWNLEWYPGLHPEQTDPATTKRQVKAAKDVLRAANPDVFVGIEMRDREAFEDLVSVVPGMHVAVVTTFRDSDGSMGRQQIGIASKLPIHAAWSENWLPTIAGLPRGFAVAALRMPGTDELLITYGVHLKSNRGSTPREDKVNVLMRNESTRQILNHVDVLKKLAFRDKEIGGFIVAGDVNTNEDGQFDDRVISMMTKGGFHNTWSGVPRDQRLTWIGDNVYSPTTFDYIFTKGLGKPTSSLVQAPPEASDHLPVHIDLSAPAPNG